MQKQDVREAQVREPASKGLLRVCSETREIADNTLDALTTQEEQLRNAHKHLATMEDDLNDGERFLRSIGSVWGQLSNYFRPVETGVHASTFDTEEAKRQQKFDKEMTKIENEFASSEKNKGSRSEPTARKALSSDPAFNEKQKYLDEQDKDMDEVLATLAAIKLRARQMNATIDASNDRLEDMHNRTERTNDRVVHQTKLATQYAK